MQTIADLLEELGLGRYAALFEREEIDLEALGELDDSRLAELGLPMGPRVKLLARIVELNRQRVTDSRALNPEPRRQAAGARLRNLTVLMCDIVDSTRIAIHEEHDLQLDVIWQFQDFCKQVARKFGGKVAHFAGDGAVIYFGYPTATEHDAGQAIMAALELMASLYKLPNVRGEPIKARVGIASGPVAVAERDTLLGEQTAIGATPNLASRLQHLAPENGILVAESTRVLVGGQFEMADLGIRALKGFESAAVRVWQVLRERPGAGRISSENWGRPLYPLFGRSREVAICQSAWEAIRAGGPGRTLHIVGDPGTGKSRLALSIAETIRANHGHVIQAVGSPYYRIRQFYPMLRHIQRVVDYDASASLAMRRAKIDSFFTRDTPLVDDAREILAGLFGLPSNLGKLAPAKRVEILIEAASNQLVEFISNSGPSAMLIEDAHYLDPASLALTRRLVEIAPRGPLLLLVTSRSSVVPDLADLPYREQITLAGLEAEDVHGLVRSVAAGKDVPKKIIESIRYYTGGVPLFVEELTKAILVDGTLQERVDRYEGRGETLRPSVPFTLQDTLTARLDKLERSRALVDTCAVIGHEFSFGLLQAVTEHEQAQLSAALEELLHHEILFAKGAPPDAVYTFKHGLLQEAAYSSILRRDRAQIHAQVAKTLEQKLPRLIKEEPLVAARHYTEAGLYEEAVALWVEGGNLASRQGALDEALQCLKQGLELVDSIEGEAKREAELELRVKLGPLLVSSRGAGSFAVKANFNRARSLLRADGDVISQSVVLRGLSYFHLARGHLGTLAELAKEVFEHGEREGNPGLRLEGMRSRGTALLLEGEFAEAREIFQAGIMLYETGSFRSHAYHYGNDPGVACYCYQARALWMLGRTAQADQAMQKGLDLAEEIAHPFSQVLAVSQAVRLSNYRGDIATTMGRVDKAQQLISRFGEFPFFSCSNNIVKGWAMARLGEIEPGLRLLRSSVAEYIKTYRARLSLPDFFALQADIELMAGQPKEALKSLAHAQKVVASTGQRYYEAEILRLEARASLALEASRHRDTAEARLGQALDSCERSGAAMFGLRVACDLAQLWRRSGRLDAAASLIGERLAAVEEGGDCVDVARAHRLWQEVRSEIAQSLPVAVLCKES